MLNSQKTDIGQQLLLTMEYSVISRLMKGNDAQCFNTQQYCDARDAWIEEVSGMTRKDLDIEMCNDYLLITCRRQLSNFPLVVEVSPDVWTLEEYAEPSEA
jgi:hypothetical protein